jgi:hypothetical protein
MKKSSEKVVMSSIIPRGLAKKLRRLLERHLSPKVMDWLSQFWIQTRILFSRTLILMVVAMFAIFTWATIKEEIFKEGDAFRYLILQSIALAILLHMNLWETEREGRTFELLIMRIPGVNRLIWFKMRVSLLWNFLLLLPFSLGFMWFLTIPLWRELLYLFFLMTVAVFAALFTCVVSSFVKRGLPTAIIVAIILLMIASFTKFGHLPAREYFQFFIFPMNERLFENWSHKRLAIMLIVNRLFLLCVAAHLYWWLYRRLQKTEKWIA